MQSRDEMPAPQLLVEPCDPSDERHEAWIHSLACALSPVSEVRDSGIGALRDLGFQVLDGGTGTGSAPPPNGSPGSGPSVLPSVTFASLLLGFLMLQAWSRPDGPICGRPTQRKKPCRNPRKSCGINHAAIEGRMAPGERKAFASMESVVAASNLNLPKGRTLHAAAADALSGASLLHAPPSDLAYEAPDAGTLARIALDTAGSAGGATPRLVTPNSI